MSKQSLSHKGIFIIVAFWSVWLLNACQTPGSFEKTSDGIIIKLNQEDEKTAQTIKLQVISDKVIHVIANPTDSLIKSEILFLGACKSLMVG